MESFKFLLDLPLLPWQQVEAIWTHNRLFLNFYMRYHKDSCTKLGVFGVRPIIGGHSSSSAT